MKQFTAETQSIIDKHKADFNCTNYESKLKSYGGYNAYIDSLGGVFKKYRTYKGNANTKEVFHEICEYVFGLYSIYGFDYYNGSTYVRWTGGSPFYVNGAKGKCNGGTIDDLCGLSSKSKTTCCNWAIDTLLRKMGWLPNGTQTYCTQVSYGQRITSKLDLRPGDIVHFYRDPNGVFDPAKPSTYSKSGWHHVVIVWDVTDTSIIMADGGSRMQRNGGKWLYEVPKTGKAIGGDYGTSDKWMSRRIHGFAVNPPSKDGKTIDDLAIEVILGHTMTGETWGNDPLRSKLLGSDAKAVQARVNEMLGNEDILQKALVRHIFEKKAGNGDVRKAYLGERWQLAQDGISAIDKSIEFFLNAITDEEWRELTRQRMKM